MRGAEVGVISMSGCIGQTQIKRGSGKKSSVALSAYNVAATLLPLFSSIIVQTLRPAKVLSRLQFEGHDWNALQRFT